MRNRTIILVIFIVLFTIPIQISAYQNTRQNGISWTFMVYMDADNSLSQYAPSDLAEMMSVGSSENLKIVVLYDSTQNGDSAIYLIENGKKVMLKSLGEVDMGSENTLKYFIDFVVKNYPATHYFLDFWDHGNNYGGVCIDHGDWLTLDEMSDALAYFQSKIGHKVDVVGFDACRMGAMSVFYALKDHAYYAVASEKDEPANGWPYDSILSQISGKNPEQVAKIVVDAMYSWAKQAYKEDGLSVIMSYVNLTKMNSFIDEFNYELLNAIPVVPYFSKQIINVTSDVERYEYTVDADFYDLMEKINQIGDYKLSNLAKSVMKGIINMTYYKAWDCPNPANGYHAKHAHGVAIYYPVYYVDPSYSSTEFSKNTYWVEFLNLLYNPYYVKGSGYAWVKMVGANMTIDYAANGSYVGIYIVNNENSSVIYSGRLNPQGKYTVRVPYGEYTVYLYSYNSEGYVIWAYQKKIEYLKRIVIKGTFSINGRVAKGAGIALTVDNRTYFTNQDRNGFYFVLYYPRDIRKNSTMKLTISYGALIWKYPLNYTWLKGSSYIYVKFDEHVFPGDVPTLIFSALITTMGVAMLLWRRR